MQDGGPDRRALEPGPLVVLGTVWTPDGCLIRLRRPGQPSELVPAAGLELRYRADRAAPRHCIGHHSPKRNDGQYVECHNRPQDGERVCVSCAVADAEFAADLHHAHNRVADEIDEAVRAHLERANILYLAAFRDGSVKVGTSTGTRRHTRLAEQGAWRAIEVATVTDGFAVRRLEDLVTERLALPQAVATTRKLRGMAAPRSDGELDAALAERCREVLALLDSEEGRAAGEATPLQEWWQFPGGDEAGWDRPLRYPLALDEGNHHLRVDAMCGRLAALTRPGGPDRFVDDLGRLFGREIEVGPFTPDEMAVQDSLF